MPRIARGHGTERRVGVVRRRDEERRDGSLARGASVAQAAAERRDAADDVGGRAADELRLPRAAALAHDEDARLVDAELRLDVGEHGAEVRDLGRVVAVADDRASVGEAVGDVGQRDLDVRVLGVEDEVAFGALAKRGGVEAAAGALECDGVGLHRIVGDGQPHGVGPIREIERPARLGEHAALLIDVGEAGDGYDVRDQRACRVTRRRRLAAPGAPADDGGVARRITRGVVAGGAILVPAAPVVLASGARRWLRPPRRSRRRSRSSPRRHLCLHPAGARFRRSSRT